MADLSYYQNQYNRLLNQISVKKALRQSCLDKAEEIKAVYERLSEDKSLMKQYKSSVKSLKNESYDNFTGTLKKEYKTKMNELAEDYQTVIDNIDYNMDLLNKKKTEYENEAYSYDGVIGWLRSRANSAWTAIQNQAN